jgi:hypothetical protein
MGQELESRPCRSRPRSTLLTSPTDETLVVETLFGGSRAVSTNFLGSIAS